MRRNTNPETDGRTSPARCKKVLHHFGALLRQNAAENIDAMIESRVTENIKAGTHGAALRIIAPVDEARDPRLDHGSRAHGAGLDCDVRSGIVQPVISQFPGRRAQGQNLRVRGGITIRDGAISRSGDNTVSEHDDASNGHFAILGRCARYGKRRLHA